MDTTCKYSVGQIIHHLRFDYRGVIVDVDATFQGTEEWYQEMAKSKPPKENPWYHVLVDQSFTMTYVAERNLEADPSPKPINHPLVDQYFSRFEKGSYQVEVSLALSSLIQKLFSVMQTFGKVVFYFLNPQ